MGIVQDGLRETETVALGMVPSTRKRRWLWRMLANEEEATLAVILHVSMEAIVTVADFWTLPNCDGQNKALARRRTDGGVTSQRRNLDLLLVCLQRRWVTVDLALWNGLVKRAALDLADLDTFPCCSLAELKGGTKK